VWVKDLFVRLRGKGAKKRMPQPDKETIMTQLIARMQNMDAEQLTELNEKLAHPEPEEDDDKKKKEGEGGGAGQQPGGGHTPGQQPHPPGQQPGQQKEPKKGY
jgi:hypothetical protein